MPTLITALRSRTIWLGLAVTALSLIQGAWASQGLTPEQLGVAGPIVGTAIMVLRALTTQPLNQK